MVAWIDPQATDNSGQISTMTCDVESGSRFQIGKTEVICQAVDPSKNQASCLFIVQIEGMGHFLNMSNCINEQSCEIVKKKSPLLYNIIFQKNCIWLGLVVWVYDLHAKGRASKYLAFHPQPDSCCAGVDLCCLSLIVTLWD